MIRLAVSVEGQTEEAFVKDVLASLLRQRGVEPIPIIIGRARSGSQGGGNVNSQRLVAEMINLRHSHDAVTSLVDFYGFRDRRGATVEELEEHLRCEIDREMPNASRLIPYVQKYEFEGILFSDTDAFHVIDQATEWEISQLSTIRQTFSTPEDINDDPNLAPSKRVMNIMPRYRKRVHGPMVAERAGLAKIRKECQRFNAWLEQLENL